jgi:hypothetical protein
MYLQASPDQRHKATRYPRLRADVGRGQRLAAPGLVVTVFNWARPRDLSHYETFEQFHATRYRYVEALSVTPFADRAIDRGLTGVLVSLVRNLSETYNGNLRAAAFDQGVELADHIVRYLK